MCESKPEDHRDDCGRSIELSSRCLLKDIPGKQFGPAGKRVQIILLDTRTFKDDPRRNPRSKAEKKAAGLSGSMGNYPPERRRLFDLVAAKNAAGVILLTGYVHFAELSRFDGGPSSGNILVKSL